MRKECADLILRAMRHDHEIVVLTADLGFGILDDIKTEFNNQRFYNTGAAEQLMIGAAVGLAEEGKIPICYSMSSFILYRPFEFLRNYANHENIPIKLIGSGRDKDYAHDGFSHWAHDNDKVLESLPNIKVYKPMSIKELEELFDEFLYNDKPSYLNLTRKL